MNKRTLLSSVIIYFLVESNYGNLYTGIALTKGQNLDEPCDSRFKLMLQDDGNLVINQYFKFYFTHWSSKTANTNASVLRVEDDGNLILSDSDGKELWSSNSGGKGIDRFSLIHDGDLVAYKGNEIVWRLGTAEKSKEYFIYLSALFTPALIWKEHKTL